MAESSVVPRVSDAQLALLRRLGFADVEHDSHVPFMSHLLGTRRVLRDWASARTLCDAGLFHSAYGTEYFDASTEVTRDEVAAVIGRDAERLVWLWCAIERDTISADGSATDRRTAERLHLARGEVEDLVTLWCADTVEQIGRMEPGERDFARALPGIIDLASPNAQAGVHDVIGLLTD